MADTEADQQEAAAQKDEDGEDGEDGTGGTAGQPELDIPHDDRLEELKEQAKGIFDRYDKRETAVLPGSDSTITGTAVNDFLDEDGEPVDHSNDSTDSGDADSDSDSADADSGDGDGDGDGDKKSNPF